MKTYKVETWKRFEETKNGAYRAWHETTLDSEHESMESAMIRKSELDANIQGEWTVTIRECLNIKCTLCDEPANNGTLTLCDKHTDELRAKNRAETEAREAFQRATARPILKEDIEKAIVCPYCGTHTEEPCCGENHNEEQYSYDGSDFMPWDEFTLHYRPMDKLTDTTVTLCPVCGRHGPNCACEPEYTEER